MSGEISFSLNGSPVEVACSPWKRLLDVLREDLRATGTKEGCGEGECGACSVVVDDSVVNACLIPVGQVTGSRVETIESVSPLASQLDGLLDIQTKLVTLGGTQCGICTPGIVVAAAKILSDVDADSVISKTWLREKLAGNICRCTGYQLIIDAIFEVAEARGLPTEVARK